MNMNRKLITGSGEDMQKSDYNRFYNSDTTGFNPDRNKAIVEETIKEYEALRAAKAKAYDEDYAERADAVVSYLKSLDKGGQATPGAQHSLMRYFGKREIARLQGLEIRQKLMAGMKVVDTDGNTIAKGI